MNKKLILISILLLSLPFLVLAEQDELFSTRGSAGLGASFINTPMNAYGISTAGILAIFANSADAVFWNPAGLAQIPNAQLQFATGLLNYDKVVSYVNFSKPYGEDKNNAFGITLLNSWVGKIDGYDSNDHYTHQIEYMGNGMIMTFAKPISIMKLGVNIKVLNEILDKTKAYGGSLDIGLSITPPLPLFLGITVNNFPGFIKWDHKSKANQIGSGYSIGIGYKDMMDRVKVGIVFCKEYGEPDVFMNLGGEFSLFSMLALRLGYYKSNFSGGLGFHLGLFDISYAFYNERFLEMDTVSNLVSLTINF